ncbi:hypothetical protein H2248_002144 [Termitomyces sp. 'cryptogamus']|nr:hypothetical protein H2248_002144 [Termitomyces sp. 'cryptogamus']
MEIPLQIASPLLENSLCFTPKRPPRASRSPSTTPNSTKRPDTYRKLRPLKQPQLPLLGYGNNINSPRPDMYRGRFGKSSKKPQRPPMTSKTSSSSTTYSQGYGWEGGTGGSEGR